MHEGQAKQDIMNFISPLINIVVNLVTNKPTSYI